jgi:hypothetical protein
VDLQSVSAVELYFVHKLVLALLYLILSDQLVRLLHLLELAPFYLPLTLVVHSQVFFDHIVVLPLSSVDSSVLGRKIQRCLDCLC